MGPDHRCAAIGIQLFIVISKSRNLLSARTHAHVGSDASSGQPSEARPSTVEK
jgi:hypothetical protein